MPRPIKCCTRVSLAASRLGAYPLERTIGLDLVRCHKTGTGGHSRMVGELVSRNKKAPVGVNLQPSR